MLPSGRPSQGAGERASSVLSFSCNVFRRSEISHTNSAHFKQELGLHVRVCVYMHLIISEESTLQSENESSAILVNVPAACPSSLQTER